MLDSVKHQVAASEIRSRISKRAADLDSLSADKVAERAKLEARIELDHEALLREEEQFREAVKREADEADEKALAARAVDLSKPPVPRRTAHDLVPEVREIMQLEEKSSLEDFFNGGRNGEMVTGAALELRTAWGAEPGQIPWSMLCDKPSERQPLHPDAVPAERAEETTDTPTSVGTYQNTIIRRVFTPAVANWLGISIQSVGIGDQLAHVITAGVSPGFVDTHDSTDTTNDRGEQKESEAATITSTTLRPRDLTAAYRIAMGDMVRVRGLESALRGDLSRAMSNALDRNILRGGSDVIPGLLHTLTDPAAGGAWHDFDRAVEMVSQNIDAVHAVNAGQLRVVTDGQACGYLEHTFRGDSTLSAGGWLRTMAGGLRANANLNRSTRAAVATAVNNSGGYAAGDTVIVVDAVTNIVVGDVIHVAGSGADHFITAVNTTNKRLTFAPSLTAAAADNATVRRAATIEHEAILALTGPGQMDNAMACIWPGGVKMIRDDVTSADRREVRLTFVGFYDFAVLRAAGFKQIKFITAT